jgi:hypothetical protein
MEKINISSLPQNSPYVDIMLVNGWKRRLSLLDTGGGYYVGAVECNGAIEYDC